MIDQPQVWTYWEGPCPDYITLCIETIRRWCKVNVLGRAEFEELWRHDRDLTIDSLYVAHRADFIRVYLLHHYGGAWIDADCIVLRSIAPLASYLSSHDLIYYREPCGIISNNFLLAKAQTSITHSYYEAVVAHVRARRPIAWLDIGSIPLTTAIERHPDAAQDVPSEAIMPICWCQSQRLLDRVSEKALEDAAQRRPELHDSRAYCYMLCNHSLPKSIKAMSRPEILTSPTLLNYLFRVSLCRES
jgi:hypothetical protein